MTDIPADLPVDWRDLAGAIEVAEQLGREPNFGDAEILSLAVERKGRGRLVVGLAADQVRSGTKPLEGAVVVFSLDGISDLMLVGFQGQNVLDALTITKVSGAVVPHTSISGWKQISALKLNLTPILGLGGFLLADRISVRLDE
jgi:hypothetical protein